MNNQKNKNNRSGAQSKIISAPKQHLLPFFVEFIKFVAGFAVIIAVALVTLRIASAAMVH